jgi:predicted transglutaminase-like protease
MQKQDFQFHIQAPKSILFFTFLIIVTRLNVFHVFALLWLPVVFQTPLKNSDHRSLDLLKFDD